jgi:hypothetical protein
MKELPKPIQNKLDLWQSKNEEFKVALAENNLVKVESLLEEGCPFYLNETLSEEEIAQIGDSNYDNLTDSFYLNFSQAIEAIYLKEDKEELFELLAEYLMYQTNEIAFTFRKNYFGYTKNYVNALHYAETLFNSFGFLKSQRNSWLLGALYNENGDFFDKFYDIYQDAQKHDPDSTYLKLDSLKGHINELGKYYNVESWKKHFSYHFPLVFEKHLNENNSDDVDSYSVLILELIKYPLEEYESGSFINKQKVKPIIDFLLEDFSSESEIQKLEYFLVAIMYEKEKEIIHQLESIGSNGVKKLRPMRRLFGNLSLNHALERNTNKLNYYIQESINKNDAQECLDIFNLINLPKDRYSVLENYVDVCQSTSINDDSTYIRKVNKI